MDKLEYMPSFSPDLKSFYEASRMQMGTININAWDAMGALSPDGRILFVVREETSGRDIYWVSFDLEAYRNQWDKRLGE